MKKAVYVVLSCLICFSAKAGDKEVLSQAYKTVVDNYVDEVMLSNIVATGLPALTQVDEKTKISVGRRTATVYYNGRLQKTISRPFDERNAAQWADFTVDVLDIAKKASPDLQRQDFELAETVLYYGIPALDKNSRYFPSLDLGQKTELPQAYYADMKEENILYIRPGTINEYIMQNFKKTMEDNQNLQGIILDLRGNKGGYLKYAVQLADMFLGNGTIIYTLGKEKGKRKIYNAHEGQLYAEMPMVILVDGQTASAAEVIALALKKHQRAVIIGTQTYGKGTVQNIYKQRNGARLALTSERFYSNDNMSIDEVGLRPDICIPNGETETIYTEDQPIKDINCSKTLSNSEEEIKIAQRVLSFLKEQKKTEIQK